MSRGRRRPTAAAATLVAVLLTTTSCTATAYERARSGDTLTLTVAPAALAHLDPQRVTDNDAQELLSGTVFRTLTTRAPTPGSTAEITVPDLATDTGTTGDGGLTWTLRLRPGITFDNALPLGCGDIKYGISRNFARELGHDGTGVVDILDIPHDDTGASSYLGPYVTAPATSPAAAGEDAYNRAVECADDNTTITFRLRTPTGDFPDLLSLPAFAPVPTTADIGPQYDERPIGTGPYRVDTLTLGESAILVRNTYWTGSQDPHRPAWPERIEIQVATGPEPFLTADPATTRTTAGPLIPPALLNDRGELATPTEHGTLATQLNGWSRHLAINAHTIPDPAVRRALQVALNREAYRDALTGSAGADLADGPLPPTSPDYRPTELWHTLLGDTVSATGDLELADTHLASTHKPATLRLDTPATGPDLRATQTIVDSFAPLGITVIVRPIPPNDYDTHLRNADSRADLTIIDSSPTNPSGLRTVATLIGTDSALNASHYSSDTVDAALLKAAPHTDRDARSTLITTAITTALKDGALIPLVFTRSHRIAGTGVGGAGLTPGTSSWNYSELWVRKPSTDG